MPSRLLRCLALVVVAPLLGCPNKEEPPPDEGLKRCELDVMAHPELFALEGSGASAFKIESDDQRMQGQFAQNRIGDFILQNDRIRVAVDQAGRDTTSQIPFGGNLIDADLRDNKDQLGKIGLIYSFGRALDVQKVEVLRDGSEGGPAIVAATGLDTLNDRVTVQAAIDKQGLNLDLVINPMKEVPLRGTNYFVLSPGEARVRVVTAMCNDGSETVLTTFGDVSAGGGTMDFFNPAQCKGSLGEADCLVDPIPYVGWQGTDVAYGFRSYKVSDPTQPEENAGMYLSRSVAVLAGTKNLSGLTSWIDSQARSRPGAIFIKAGESANYVRDLVVGRDLAEVNATWLRLDGAARGTVDVAVTRGGQPVSGARVVVEEQGTGRLLSLAIADGNGKAKATVAPGSYSLRAAVVGLPISAAKDITVVSGEAVPTTIDLAPVRKLTVTAKDSSGAPIPAKAVIKCKTSPCGWTSASFSHFQEIDVAPDDVAAITYLPPQGSADVLLPPGQYEVMVTRGPEFSAWPDTVPVSGFTVDLTSADATANAVIARVVDSTGWMSADLHVHAVNSADASPSNESRVLSFLAEGVDMLVSTDHEFLTDYRPVVQSLGANALMSTIIGSEISPDFAHQNAYPVVPDGTFTGGAFDWMGGLGPTLRPPQMWTGMHDRWPGALVQLNHPRGNHGLLTNMKVDTLTGASHSDPVRDRMEPDPEATPQDTRLFATNFDVFELLNGAGPNYSVLNDWMLFLSRGIVRTASAVSDSHNAFGSPAGYGRTFVQVGTDDPQAFDATKLTDALKARKAFGTNAPFLSVTAHRLDSAGTVIGDAAGMGDTVSVNKTAGEKVRFDVTVQAPEWIQFDRIELYTHAAGREAWNGEGNGAWPTSRILQTQTLNPAALTVEPVPGNTAFRRVKVTQSFEVTPSSDGWYVVMVRSTGAARELFPLCFETRCDSGVCTHSNERAFAFSNPVFVDADGSGAYDDYPIKLTQPLSSPPPLPLKRGPFVPTEAQAQDILRAVLRHSD